MAENGGMSEATPCRIKSVLGAMSPIICPSCALSFAPKRKDQRYCAKQCARKATRNATTGTRKVAEGPEARRSREFLKGCVVGLSHALYETPPQYRAAFMQRLIAVARGSAQLRELLTNRTGCEAGHVCAETLTLAAPGRGVCTSLTLWITSAESSTASGRARF